MSTTVAETVPFTTFYNCHEDSSPLFSIILDLADRSLSSLHIKHCHRDSYPESILVCATRISLDPSIVDRCCGGITTIKHYHEGQLPYLPCHRDNHRLSIT